MSKMSACPICGCKAKTKKMDVPSAEGDYGVVVPGEYCEVCNLWILYYAAYRRYRTRADAAHRWNAWVERLEKTLREHQCDGECHCHQGECGSE